MKPAKVGAAVSTAVASWQQPGPGSQIPLPLRRGSSKSDKGQESDSLEADISVKNQASRKLSSEKSNGKSSILGSTSFCCASGQKDECVSETRVPGRPLKKKPPKNVSNKEIETVSSNGLKRTTVLPRGRNSKPENDPPKDKSKREGRRSVDSPVSKQSSLFALPVPGKRPSVSANNRLLDNRKQSQERPQSNDSGSFRDRTRPASETEMAKNPEYTNVMRDIQKVPPDYKLNNLMSVSFESNKLYGKVTNVVSALEKNESRDANKDCASGVTEDYFNFSSVDLKMKVDESNIGQKLDTAMIKSCDTDDLDCPCCNLDQNSDEIFVHKNCDTNDKLDLPSSHSVDDEKTSGVMDSVKDKKISDLECEMRTLETKLKSEREKSQSQRHRILELEKELQAVDQLKEDLAKEKTLRRESEDKLLKKLETSCPRTTIEVSTQVETEGASDTENTKVHEHTSSFQAYESRIRRYQVHISKLEKDNAMLVEELKKFQDLSPCSQSEQAKLLLEKLSQLEIDNQQQQIEYESCLDDVANKLVHTLLIQKRLEEECQVLHLRVEQLELENSDLQKRFEIKNQNEKQFDSSPSNYSVSAKTAALEIATQEQERLETWDCSNGSSQDVLSTPLKKHSRVSNPGDKASNTFQIPALNSSKTSNRKRTKCETNNGIGKIHSLVTTNSETHNLFAHNTSASEPSNSQYLNQHLDQTENSKLSSVKRKRPTKSGSQGDNCSKEPRVKSQHIRWDTKVQNHEILENISENCSTFTRKASVLPITKIPVIDHAEQVQEVWSFTVDNMPSFPDSLTSRSEWSKNALGKNALDDTLENELRDGACKLSSPSHDVDGSLSIEGTHRTRDEGYSTMSSDQQQDSAADTTVSEQDEHSTLCIAVQAGSRFVSDDSVTECLDGSMTSSSDSGFGPLQQIAVSNRVHHLSDSCDNHKTSDCCAVSRTTSPSLFKDTIISSISTYIQDHSDETPMTIKTTQPCVIDATTINFYHDSSVSTSKGNNFCSSYFINTMPLSPAKHSSTILCETHSVNSKQKFSTQSFPPENTHNACEFHENSQMLSCVKLPHPVVATCSSSNHASSPLHEYKDILTQDLKVETAEKATLTEPEEITWREKALAHFIDESIWSLYSSESDTQVRFLSANPSREFSPIDNVEMIPSVANATPKIVITKDIDTNSASCQDINDVHFTETSSQFHRELTSILSSKTLLGPNNSELNSRSNSCSRGLERVASDSVLCLKDAVHELEDSMQPSLKMARIFKTSKNIPFFCHYSASDVSGVNCSILSPDALTSPEILLNLEKTMLQNNYVWPLSVNPSRSSSVCSLQSSNSCHVISDETDDVDAMRQPSRKGSEDPDLSSASDTEYENMEHKDFVEQWIQKEISKDLSSPKQLPMGAQEEMPSIKKKLFCQYTNSQTDAIVDIKETADKGSLPVFCSVYDTQSTTKPGIYSQLSDKIESSQANSAILCTDNVSISSASSSIVYPIIFTCENLEDDVEPSPNFTELEVDLELLDAEVKEFNEEFYKLCNVGSSMSLDHVLPAILGKVENRVLDIPLKQYPLPLPPRGFKIPSVHPTSIQAWPKKTEELPVMKAISKPTGYVKPIRPVTLTFSDVPNPVKFSLLPKKDLPGPVQSEKFTTSSESKTHQMNSQNSIPNKECDKSHPSKKGNISPKKQSNIPSACKRLPNSSFTADQNSVRQRTATSSNKGSYSQKYCLPVNQNSGKNPAQSPRHYKARSKSNSVCVTNELSSCEGTSKQGISYCISDCDQGKPRRKSVPLSKEQGVVSKRPHWRKERRSSRYAESKEGCGTAWVHLNANPSLADPKARASFLDSMAETISSSGSSSEDDECGSPVIHSASHLQRLCREKRQRIKASRGGDFLAFSPRHRVSVINRECLYYRFGEQERAAISCFDFLEDIPTSSSEPGSLEAFHKRLNPPTDLDTSTNSFRSSFTKERVNLVSPCASDPNSASCRSRASSFSSRLRVPVLWNKPLSHNMSSSTLNSQDYDLLDHISLSDSCAESYSSTPDSFEDAT